VGWITRARSAIAHGRPGGAGLSLTCRGAILDPRSRRGLRRRSAEPPPGRRCAPREPPGEVAV